MKKKSHPPALARPAFAHVSDVDSQLTEPGKTEEDVVTRRVLQAETGDERVKYASRMPARWAAVEAVLSERVQMRREYLKRRNGFVIPVQSDESPCPSSK